VILPRRFITGLVIPAVLLGSTASAQEYKAQQATSVYACEPLLKHHRFVVSGNA